MRIVNLAYLTSLLIVAVACGESGERGGVEALPQNLDGPQSIEATGAGGTGGRGGGVGGVPTGPYGCPFDPVGVDAGGASLADVPANVAVATIDATIQKSTPSTNYGNDVRCNVKGGSGERSCLIKFGLAGLPTDLVVTKACLQLAVAEQSVRQFSPRRLLQPWTESGATWNDRQSGVAWAAPGAKGSADRDPMDLAVIPGSVTGIIAVPFSVAVLQDWIANPSGNHGMTIAHSEAYDGVSFLSAEGPASGIPRLLFE